MKLSSLNRGDLFRVRLRHGGASLPFIFGHIQGDMAICLHASEKLQGMHAEMVADVEVDLVSGPVDPLNGGEDYTSAQR